MTRSAVGQTQATSVTVRVFTQRFSATPRGARLARHLALNQLDVWGVPHGDEVSDRAGLIVAELAANAVTHGRVPGRDFELRLLLDAVGLRIDVSDTRGEARPPAPGRLEPAAPLADTGRGLRLVEALADCWEVVDRVPGPGKTVRAQLLFLRGPLTRKGFDSTVPSDDATAVRHHEQNPPR
ncbi:ATP-binding protein [Streptomyces griseosporeus]|uniref:ATP-binding protein n=1 Tax=Streptomyces griseosporeus TaxID=1910 RepID=UPI00369FDB0F